MDRKLQVLVVDDHPAFLKGMSESIGSLPIVGRIDTCLNRKELKNKLIEFVPDVVFLDLNLPDSNGFVICEELKRAHKDMFVAIVTSYDAPLFVERAGQSGASAYFLKNTELEMYCQFLKDVQEGRLSEYFIHIPFLKDKQEFAAKDSFELKATLTKREREVMKMIVDGHDHRYIEEKLGIGYEGFRAHHNHVLEKLGLKNDVELVHFADKYLLEIDY